METNLVDVMHQFPFATAALDAADASESPIESGLVCPRLWSYMELSQQELIVAPKINQAKHFSD